MCMIRIKVVKSNVDLFRTSKGAPTILCTSRAALHPQNYKPTKIIISLLVTIQRIVLKQTSGVIQNSES